MSLQYGNQTYRSMSGSRDHSGKPERSRSSPEGATVPISFTPKGDRDEQTIHDSLELLRPRGVVGKQACRRLDHPVETEASSRWSFLRRRRSEDAIMEDTHKRVALNHSNTPRGLRADSRFVWPERRTNQNDRQRRRSVTLGRRHATAEADAVTGLLGSLPKQTVKETYPKRPAAIVRRRLPARPDDLFKEPCRTCSIRLQAAEKSGPNRNTRGWFDLSREHHPTEAGVNSRQRHQIQALLHYQRSTATDRMHHVRPACHVTRRIGDKKKPPTARVQRHLP